MGDHRSLRVVVVEDDVAQRHLLRLSLENRGHVVIQELVRGDDPALALVSADVAIVDLGLPGKSGVEVIRVLRDRNIPSLVLSASAHRAAVTEALLAGALGYLVKGARLTDIVDAIEVVAQGHHVLPALGAPTSRKLR